MDSLPNESQTHYPSMTRTMNIANQASEIVKAVKWLANMSTALGLSMKECFALELSLEEILTNVVGYAFDEHTEFTINISFAIQDDRVILQVEDPGKPFNPLDLPPPKPITNLADVKIGGLGVHIVRKLMHELSYSRLGGKNILTAVLNLTPHKVREIDDGLTGLYMRQHFDIRLNEELARIKRHGGDLSLVMTDVDNFDKLSEQYGLHSSDYILKELANILKSSIRRDVDIPCRYSGEKFATILPATNVTGAKCLAERFRRTCEEHEFTGSNSTIKLTISCGIASVTGEIDMDHEEFVKRSFSALVQAGTTSQNCVLEWHG